MRAGQTITAEGSKGGQDTPQTGKQEVETLNHKMLMKSEPMIDFPDVTEELESLGWVVVTDCRSSVLFYFFAAQLCQSLDKTSNTSQRTRLCNSLHTSPSDIQHFQQFVVLEFRLPAPPSPQSAHKDEVHLSFEVGETRWDVLPLATNRSLPPKQTCMQHFQTN